MAGKPHSADHSTPRPIQPSTHSAVNHQPPAQTQATATGSRTIADRTRRVRSLQREAGSARTDPETPLAPGVFREPGGEMLGLEVGPEDIEEHQFRVRRLP